MSSFPSKNVKRKEKEITNRIFDLLPNPESVGRIFCAKGVHPRCIVVTNINEKGK